MPFPGTNLLPQPLRRRSRMSLVAILSIQIAALCFSSAFGPGLTTASAESEQELQAKRTQWQDQYRTLLRNRLTLEENIAKSNKDYAQAQRRNYPRGGAREKFRIQAEEAEVDLEKTNREISALFEDARRAGVPPGWLYEVEDEDIVANQPASADSAPDEDDRAGRNPLYLDDEEER